MMGPDPAEWNEAGQLLEDYIQARPDDFMALTMKACFFLRESVYGLEPVDPKDAREAKKLLARARQLNEQSDFLHLIRAEYCWGVDGNLSEAVRAVERSLDVTPDYVLALNARARFNIFAGRMDEALELFEHVLPMLAQNRIVHRILACKSMCEFAVKNTTGALDTARKSLNHAPNYPHSLALAAAAASAEAQSDLASDAINKLLEVRPHLTLSKVRQFGFAGQEIEEYFRTCLVTAGLPPN